MSFEFADFYMDRKQCLEELRKQKSSSPAVTNRMIEILSLGAEEGLVRTVEDEFAVINRKQFDDNSTFEERFKRYIKEIEEYEERKTNKENG